MLFDPALHPELSQDRHHLPHGDSGRFRQLIKQESFNVLTAKHMLSGKHKRESSETPVWVVG
jgi:hypothetical protein